MKIKTTIVFLILTFQIFAQTNEAKKFEIGISYSPTFTNSLKYDRGPAFNFAFGAFTRYQTFKKLGISIGVDYQRQNINTTQLVNCDPLGHPFFCESPSQDKFKIIKFPVWLSFNMNYKSNPKLKADLIGGYAFGKLLNPNRKETEYRLHGLINNLHFGIIGIEFQRRIVNDIKLTLGSHLEITNIYDKRYGEIQNIKILLRISK